MMISLTRLCNTFVSGLQLKFFPYVTATQSKPWIVLKENLTKNVLIFEFNNTLDWKWFVLTLNITFEMRNEIVYYRNYLFWEN